MFSKEHVVSDFKSCLL